MPNYTPPCPAKTTADEYDISYALAKRRIVYSFDMSKHRASSETNFGIRVGAVIPRGDTLLLVRHDKPDQKPYWVLPGGRLEPGESIPECATREVAEETNLTGRFAGIIHVSEFQREGRHTVDVTALVEVDPDEEATLGSDPEVEENTAPTLKEVRWVGFEELEDIELLPEFLKERLISDARDGWASYSNSGIYLGGQDE